MTATTKNMGAMPMEIRDDARKVAAYFQEKYGNLFPGVCLIVPQFYERQNQGYDYPRLVSDIGLIGNIPPQHAEPVAIGVLKHMGRSTSGYCLNIQNPQAPQLTHVLLTRADPFFSDASSHHSNESFIDGAVPSPLLGSPLMGMLRTAAHEGGHVFQQKLNAMPPAEASPGLRKFNMENYAEGMMVMIMAHELGDDGIAYGKGMAALRAMGMANGVLDYYATPMMHRMLAHSEKLQREGKLTALTPMEVLVEANEVFCTHEPTETMYANLTNAAVEMVEYEKAGVALPTVNPLQGVYQKAAKTLQENLFAGPDHVKSEQELAQEFARQMEETLDFFYTDPAMKYEAALDQLYFLKQDERKVKHDTDDITREELVMHSVLPLDARIDVLTDLVAQLAPTKPTAHEKEAELELA